MPNALNFDTINDQSMLKAESDILKLGFNLSIPRILRKFKKERSTISDINALSCHMNRLVLQHSILKNYIYKLLVTASI